ncbi:hypothetical protein A2291_05960 [candidate division WOR-1 bacterium RIFOXYB2_FULL_42_35]|uniref:DUF3467 domain-containing protein n=1 Tax=candidate division WOR-1 bacterium RIFOXYC2_FULL_41_25 TaxID=1802586 RepID=A0A1F4TJG3_UNCSA|nr:MAG: hypothetical protein A2247_00735 [candidate division WOR-1 bacterium RIFOXYA2_FULL_41_14]OGC21679.1 MAG: hypothetical protein A2291_05960 [candidate division WOR-1 bacterium RIFOXYB2_FULL_42_35]OGC32858.1 MAG: hypothetical protein A2462_05930 [candidate division WOR-1 bacterium RIFOXYC2_FULL_41_25]OGC42866.1 MAG: hypothetical protein A2548_01535 [candidate division WOR-1 bacterium RIFOXYD2_FULL_41_8]
MSDKQINVELDAQTAEGKYANLALITHTENEFVFDFALVVPPKGKVCSRIITSPAHAKRFLKALGNNLKQFESKFGPIKESTEPQKPTIGFSKN